MSYHDESYDSGQDFRPWPPEAIKRTIDQQIAQREADPDFRAAVEAKVRRLVFDRMTQEVHDVNQANGWWDSDRTIGDACALLHSEVSEAFDAWRKHGFEDTTAYSKTMYGRGDHGENLEVVIDNPKPEGYGSELADVLIRLLDQADRDGIDLVAEYERKLAYNRTRGYRHGGRRV